MKRLIYVMLSLTATCVIISCHSGSAAGGVEKSFKVWGNCEKCKARIEKAAEFPGISNINWNVDTKQLVFKDDTTVTSPDAVLNAVAMAGYDNERYTANAEAYDQLPECCQYERKALKQ